MKLNERLKRAIDRKKENVDKRINEKSIFLLLALGTKIILVYLFFIFLGRFMSRLLNFRPMIILWITLATLANIYILVKTIKEYYGDSKNN